MIDYGAGNLTSVRRGLARAGLAAVIPESIVALNNAPAIIIPGVGHFSATRAISDDWREAIRARIRAGVPLLGICLGMQWLFEGSTEAPDLPGLGLVQGRCQSLTHFTDADPNTRTANTTAGAAVRAPKVPHLGWNRVDATGKTSRLLAGVTSGAFAYFAHSFAAPVGSDVVATTRHSATFTSVVERDNVFGAQFHPELSGDTGARIFLNFAAIVEGRAS